MIAFQYMFSQYGPEGNRQKKFSTSNNNRWKYTTMHAVIT